MNKFQDAAAPRSGMRSRMAIRKMAAVLAGLCLPAAALAQPPDSAPPAAEETASPSVPPPAATPAQAFAFGAGLTASTLGPGLELAAGVTRNTDVRVGYNGFLDVHHDFSTDDIDYDARFKLHSLTALFDYFPFSGIFHLSAGLAYGGAIEATADASAPAGMHFQLNDVEYTSSQTDPVTGKARIDFRKIAPMVTLGWGNLVPRSRHFNVSFEIGALFQGSARSTLALQGEACQGSSGSCATGVDVATDPTVQSNVQAEEHKLDHQLHDFSVYPVASFGLGYRF